MTQTRSRDTTLPRMARTRWARILIPALLLVAFATEFLTREGPDYSLDSWVGIALVPAVALHLTGNAGWLKRVSRRKRQDRDFGLGLLVKLVHLWRNRTRLSRLIGADARALVIAACVGAA